MRKKRHSKHKNRGRKTPRDLSLEQLEKRALQRVESGHFKIAIADLKELLKRERRTEWLDALAAAYVGHSAELASKGMLKEALTIWRNRTKICGKPMNDPGYLELLLANDDIAGASEWLQQELPGLRKEKNALHVVRSLCAARVLGGMQGLVEAWPEDDQLRKDLPAAQRALDAYCSGDDSVLEAALKLLPFRSPFRDLKSIFKTLLQLPDAPQAAAAPLEKICVDSPFYPLALGVLGALSTTAEPAAGGLPANRQLTEFTQALRGVEPETAAAANELAHQQKRPNPVQLVKTLYKHRLVFGEDFANEAALRLTIHAEHEKRHSVFSAYCKTFDRTDNFVRKRCSALTLEAEMDMMESAVQKWGEVFYSIDSTVNIAEEDKHLAKALILRRSADHILNFLGYRSVEALDYLNESLDFDPEHTESYIFLAQRYRDINRLKDARRIAERAEARWPEDPRVLVELAHNAIAGGAFHKAARIARSVLQFDPVNVEIKQLLFDAHIAHARKKIADNKLKLADNELLQAVEWAAADSSRGRIELLHGIAAFKQGDKSAASTLIASACDLLGVLRGRLLLAIEATGFSLESADLMRIAGIKKRPGKFQPADVMAIVPEIEAILLNTPEQATDAIADFIPTLKQGATLEFKENELIRLCELWRRHDHFRSKLLEPYAEAGERRWPDSPVFDFFVIEAQRSPQRPLSDDDEDEMYEILHYAREQGDDRTVALVDQVLKESLRLLRLGYERETGAEPVPAAPPVPEIKRQPVPATRYIPEEDPFAASDQEPAPRQFSLFDEDSFADEQIEEDLSTSKFDLPAGMTPDEAVDGILALGVPPDIAPMQSILGESRFRDFLKLIVTGDVSAQKFEEILVDLHRSKGENW
jgi:tetratricopeptide (TPR) repeat protein